MLDLTARLLPFTGVLTETLPLAGSWGQLGARPV
jgi:hypothetical protein